MSQALIYARSVDTKYGHGSRMKMTSHDYDQ
jgi:hypothetical protein